MEIEETENENREHAVLERILTLKQLLKDQRGGPLELHELGICYFVLNNFKQTAEYLEELLEKYPDYLEIAAANTLRIFSLIKEGMFADAEKLIEQRLKTQKQDTTLLGLQAHIFEKSGNHKKAIQVHRRILELDPDNINSKNSLGYLLTLHGSDSDRDEALRLLTGALRQKPDYPAYLDSLGVLLDKKGKKDQARKALMKALKRAPGNTVILDHLKDLLGIK